MIINSAINGYPVLMIVWNLFLALVPVWIALHLAKRLNKVTWKSANVRQRVYFVVGFLAWFFFFPNTAYLFTIVRHLVDYCLVYNEYRVCPLYSWQPVFFFTYAALGLPTFWVAMNRMTHFLMTFFKASALRFFPIIVMPIMSLGVLMGLIQRFNTWDLTHRPFYIIQKSLIYITDVRYLINWMLITLLFWVIYLVMDFLTQLHR
ncbi:DUF1361 domain-containing protein [Candidatus Peregrinibacteria bacterium]|nr:MAG: DUF1361 domain-containing protein [Candidatus Peregrinibacteria bacterium]